MTDLTAVPYPYTAVIRTNFAQYPSFETGTTGWVAAGTASPTLAQLSDSTSFAGTNCARATATVAAGTMIVAESTYRTTVSTGQTWTASAYVRGTPGITVQARIGWSGGSTVLGTAVTLTSSWQRVSVTATVPASITAMAAAVVSGTASVAVGSVMDVDAVLIEAGSALAPYFDGASTAADAYVGQKIYWYSTPNASSSLWEVRTPTSAATQALDVGVEAWDGTSDPLQTIHRLLSTSDIVVTIARPSGPRQGTLRCFCPTMATANAVETVLRTGLVMINTPGVDRVTMYGQMSGVQVTPGTGALTYAVSASFIEMGKGSSW